LSVGIIAAALSTVRAQEQSPFPYEARILKDNTTIRSGPGDVDYPTDRLEQGAAVRVLRHHADGWCSIEPPKGSFSLVPASAVQRLDYATGVVRAHGVKSWVGTGLGRVERPQSQFTLGLNQQVEILGKVSWPSPDGQSTSDWYQISPPAGELRWVRMADLQLPSQRRQQPKLNAYTDKTTSTQLDQQTRMQADHDVLLDGVAQASMHSVSAPVLPTGNSPAARPTWTPPQTPSSVIVPIENDANVVQNNSPIESSTFQSQLQSQERAGNVGTNFYRTNEDFSKGLVVEGKNAALKIGGYVKLDVIYDFNPIDNTDSFDVNSIPIGAPPRTNSRIHVRQSRLNFDTRFETEHGIAKTFVEGDFFSEGNRFRLRHAFGELNQFLGGQTWTTFANIDASPATLDFEGSVSSITPRRGQVRWTFPVYNDWTLALALEDSTTEIELPPGGTITGDTRTISPDFVARLRRTGSLGNFQIAGIARRIGFQPTGEEVITGGAWGLNFSQVAQLDPDNKVYWQINYGDGIASLLGGLPDITPTASDSAALLGYFGWMAGTTHEWNDKLSSNFTFAESHFRNTSGQPSSDINNLTYLAANMIWTPVNGIELGIEYLYGKRENINGASGLANRIQFAIFYYLP
jgi:hypothetical protein